MLVRTVWIVVFLFGCGPTTADLAKRDNRIRELEMQAGRDAETRKQLEKRLETLGERNRQLEILLDGLSADVDALERDRKGLQHSFDEAQKAMSSLEHDHAGLRSELDDAGRALEQVRAREQRARTRLKTFRTMLQQLHGMIDSGELRIRVVRNRMVVELPEAVLFDTGRAKIRQSGKKVLTELAPVLAFVSDREVQVGGHTDNRPIRTRRFPSNWELASARALRVARFLMEHGLPRERVSASAHADTQPVASNDTEEGKQQNRRIELVLLPNLDELPDLSSLERAVAAR